MGVTSCEADPDVWLRPDLKSNGVKCYQHVLLRTHNNLEMMEEPEQFIREELGKIFTLKDK